MSLLDVFTGGKSGEASEAHRKALEALQAVAAPTTSDLTLPELQKYAVAQNMTPAQTQAFLQANNAFNDQNIGQTGTQAQIAAINRLAEVADAGAEGSATQRAQIAKVNQDAARNLAGQRGAIDQQAQARGVSPGMLQAALGSQRAGEGLQDAHMAALQAQGQNYQQALAAMASGASAGNSLQGQQNTQANTVAQAQNAMQQFNAANQQQAAGQNAGYQQQANMQNTQNANQTGAANTGLANQRTQYNANLPQQVFNNNLQKASGVAGQYGNIANNATQQGQQNMGIYGGLIGGAATLAGGPIAGMAASQAMKGGANGPPASANTEQYRPQYAKGGMVGHERCYHDGGICLTGGGMVPGEAKVPGDSLQNDTVNAKLSPGELVVPRTAVPGVMNMMQGQNGSHNPQDIAALLMAMKQMRGA